MEGPLRAAADNNDAAWKAYSFNVPGLTVLGGKNYYEYKLPYTIQQIGCCARISPWCHACDLTPCFAPCNKGGAPTFMDMVDQRSGDQVRYRAVKSMCRPPKVLMFRNGQIIGHASRTLRCCNRCQTCWEDVCKKPVTLIGLHNPDKKAIARVNRDGRGWCLEARCEFPLKCIGCCFVCAACTVAMRPTADPGCGGRIDYCLAPHGCLSCDPVCCVGCLRGPKTTCMMDSVPCLACGVPCKSPSIWCPMPKCKSKPLETVSTIKLETHTVEMYDQPKAIGMIQFQYRGNFPSAYTHDQTKPLNAAVACETSDIGLLASGVAVGKVYEMGDAEAPFYDLPPRPAGRSPDYDGWVTVKQNSQVKRLVDKLRDEDLVVELESKKEEPLILGDPISGISVRGWVLTDIGWTRKGSCLTQGAKQDPRPVKTKLDVNEIVSTGLKEESGEYGTDFIMRFRLPDHEKAVVTEGFSTGFNKFGQGFTKNMLEEVACVCICMRVWKAPCNLSHEYKEMCRMPLYARTYTGGMQTDVKNSNAPPPIQVVMNTRAL